MKTRITSEHTYGDKHVTLYSTELPNEEAQFAMDIVRNFGLVAAESVGESVAGVPRLQLLSVAEVVARAFDLAQAAFDAAREKGWMIAAPDLNEINAESDAKRKVKDRERV